MEKVLSNLKEMIEKSSDPYAVYLARVSVDLLAAAAPQVVADEPVAAAISYWKGPTNSNGTPRECGDANIGRWLDYEPTTLKHGMAIKDRGDLDKRVKFLFDAAPVQPVAVPDGWQATDDEIAAWADRHDLRINSATDRRAVFEDAESLRPCPAAPAAQGDAKDAINAELVAALKDITDDICERFDMESSSTNPGIKNCVERARAAIAAKAASTCL